MKFTSKKSVSEVVIDLEDGCIVKLTKHNLLNVNICNYITQFETCFKIDIELTNGLGIQLKTSDENFLSDLSMLISNWTNNYIVLIDYFKYCGNIDSY